MPPSNPRRLSLQQIVESRRRAAFVGREAELGLFRANFTLPPEDPRHRFVFHVRGNAGVGKTSLLREWGQSAEEFGALTAAADESADSVPDVLAAFAEQFAEQGRPLKAFDRLLAIYRRALHEAAGRLAADNEAPVGGPSPGALAAAQAGLLAAGAIPVVGALAGGIDPAVVARGAGGLRAVFGGRARQQEEARLLAEPVQVLTPVFVAELDRVADAVPWVALFLDTYERTAPQLDRWLADLLASGRYGELPANLVLTLAGQRRLDPAHWGDRGRLVADVPLRPFTEEEARQLLHERGVVAEPVVREVLRLSGGLPVLVSTLAANPGAAGEANATAVERFLAGESDPARRAAALACALPRRFDEDLVAVAVPQDGPQAVPGLYDWLHELPFVAEPYSGRSRYHAVVRAPMLRLQRTGSPQRWKAAHDRLAEAFAARRDAAAEGIDPERLWAEQPWRRAALDVLYHRLCARPRTALPEALRAGIELLAQRPSRARHWARTLVDAGEDADDAVLREWGRDLLAAIIDHGPRPTAALGLLLTRAELTDRDRAAALVARAWDRFRAGELEAALSDHGRAVAVDPRSERAHQGRAVILRSLGRYEEALADLDRAEEIAPAWAWAVRERGETYRRMGRLEEALTVLDRAHALDPSDAVPLGSRGLVRHVLGRPEEALDDFDRAIALWPEYAWALVRRARVRTVLGDPVGALADLDRAEELNPGRAGTEGERGEVYRATGRYEEAVACYGRALALDPDYAWAHGSRAAALEALGRIPEARADLDRALELDPDYAWARERRERLGAAGAPAAGVPSPCVPSAE
ncbi:MULTISPECIES: tetratricopeptide repeat protein [Streptomyces]|uniref:tetratricopeptide repeat protein n=1 Tax=Streptomyces TaxID=1883 RepID=UPI0004CB2246|nr:MULTISPECIES: tetratricopeptide repeat protein [Streptomyces]MDX2919239.1 tetratricopeptide repeat protein [Streptomyces sp. NE06-03C]MDX3606319.1 tetratricopeptide repeat protein [Streptomyces sp. FL06-04B]MDX3735265.1 tetratricopeptide repeat protein [Streptomyces sp. ID01-15D]